MLGYIIANGCRRVERRFWYPLASGFEEIINIRIPKNGKYDPQGQLVRIVQKRLGRLKGNCDGELPFDNAFQLFNQVYGTFSR